MTEDVSALVWTAVSAGALTVGEDDAGVGVLYAARGGVRDPYVVTQAFLQSKYSVPTGQAYADLATLRGDASDGLPGVAGIGEKTGAILTVQQTGRSVATHGSVATDNPVPGWVGRLKGLTSAPACRRVAPATIGDHGGSDG